MTDPWLEKITKDFGWPLIICNNNSGKRFSTMFGKYEISFQSTVRKSKNNIIPSKYNTNMPNLDEGIIQKL